ncbi:MAG: sigma-70 family RNA polymerase sigma factor [Clostridia bacterium]|nr:sigma-70 family RNA polymerase sigma factor [Clostridia bacterium]
MVKNSREEKIESNIGLVYSIANRFSGKGIDYEDLVQIGCIGLIKAVDNFDESRGFSFSTYAVPLIIGEIRQHFRDDGTVKVSRSIKELGRKIGKLREEFFLKNGKEPTVKEIAEEIGISSEETARAINASMPVFSLTVNEDESQSEFNVPVESYDKDVSDKIALLQVLDTLEENDRLLIKCRYFDELNQTKTAEIIGITQVQVSRREKKLLNLLRSKLA